MKGQFIRNRAQAILKGNGEEYKLPEDGWHMIAPYGEFPGVLEKYSDGKLQESQVTQVINKAIASRLAEKFEGELLTDYEHDEENTIAAGWVQNIEAREDGLYAHIRWSARGRADVEGGNYRFFSPVFATRTVREGVEEPISLIGNTVTNRPNFRKALPAISNKAETQPKDSTMNPKLLALLGLAAGADEAAIETAVGSIENKLAELDSVKAELQQVKNSQKSLLESQADADVETYASVISNKEVVRTQLIENREPTLELLKSLKAKPAPPPAPQHMKNKATPPAGGAASEQDQEEAKAQRISNKAKQLMADGSHPIWADAFRAATAEVEKEG